MHNWGEKLVWTKKNHGGVDQWHALCTAWVSAWVPNHEIFTGWLQTECFLEKKKKKKMTGLCTLRNIRNFLHQTPVPSKPLRILAAEDRDWNIPVLLLSLSLFYFSGNSEMRTCPQHFYVNGFFTISGWISVPSKIPQISEKKLC